MRKGRLRLLRAQGALVGLQVTFCRGFPAELGRPQATAGRQVGTVVGVAVEAPDGGLELGGVPLATMLSQLIGLPAMFVRKEAKTYGTCRLAEGGELDGRRLTVVEDVVTSGGQVVTSCGDLRERGAVVEHAVCVIDREAGGAKNLAEVDVELRALYTMRELEDAAG